jgi:hemolysin III
VTHGVGALAAVAGLVILTVRALRQGATVHVVASVVFGAALVLLYAASTAYHGVPPGRRAKHVLRVADHCAVYLLIAGTYTPLTLITLEGAWGWSLFGVVWGLAAAGIAFKLFFTGRLEALSLAIYLAMGWCVVAAAGRLAEALAAPGLALLLAGGLCYTGGVGFYLWRRLRYNHAIWHGFVLAGSVLHYLAVLLYVLPA